MNIIDKDSLLNIVWPVGSIYTTTSNVSPKTLFGGNWDQVTNKFLMSAGTQNLPDNSGSREHYHTSTSTSLTKENMPSHTHNITIYEGGSHKHNKRGTAGAERYGGDQCVAASRLGEDPNEDFGLNPAGDHYHSVTVGFTGSGKEHNHGNTDSVSNIPSYYAVYHWKRIS